LSHTPFFDIAYNCTYIKQPHGGFKMSVDFFVVFGENEVIMNGKNCNLPNNVSQLVSKSFDVTFEDKTDTKNFEDLFSSYNEDEDVKYMYSLKYGCFTEYKGSWTLEEIYPSMNAMWEDMKTWSMGHFIDFYYRPYILVESTEIEEFQYDTLWEKYM